MELYQYKSLVDIEKVVPRFGAFTISPLPKDAFWDGEASDGGEEKILVDELDLGDGPHKAAKDLELGFPVEFEKVPKSLPDEDVKEDPAADLTGEFQSLNTDSDKGEESRENISNQHVSLPFPHSDSGYLRF